MAALFVGFRQSLARADLLSKVPFMTIDIVALQPLIALIAGILILLVPRILNYIVAIYLIIIGIVGLWSHIVLHTPH